MGASSATEYPAFETPTHMLMPAATSQSGTNTLTALTSPIAGVGPPTQRPMRRHKARRTRPPAVTLSVCVIEYPLDCGDHLVGAIPRLYLSLSVPAGVTVEPFVASPPLASGRHGGRRCACT